jgi:hypothetical protein
MPLQLRATAPQKRQLFVTATCQPQSPQAGSMEHGTFNMAVAHNMYSWQACKLLPIVLPELARMQVATYTPQHTSLRACARLADLPDPQRGGRHEGRYDKNTTPLGCVG